MCVDGGGGLAKDLAKSEDHNLLSLTIQSMNRTSIMSQTNRQNPLKYTVEICVDSLQSAENAIRGGATRLEVCSSLSEGGLTPTPGLVRGIKSLNSKIPLYCMIRIRPGNFVYTPEELRAMLVDLNILSQYGADGFVFGALTEDYRVDEMSCTEVIIAAAPKRVTFHRAFDEVREPFQSLEVIIHLGFQRILTSGQQNTAIEGLGLIERLVHIAANRIIVMPGSGVNSENIYEIQRTTKAYEFHASAKVKIADSRTVNKVKMTHAENFLFIASEDLVRNMIDALNNGKKVL